MVYRTLISSSSEKVDVNIYSTALGLSELGLGSLLHNLHIPLAGTFLSFNQIFLITCSLAKTSSHRTWDPFLISTRAALLKCLAPMGKTMTPMLAICMQGLLYNIGTICFGNTRLGRLTGGILASVWGFCQPLLLYQLFFGPAFVEAIHSFAWVETAFWGLLFGRMALAALITFFGPYLPIHRVERYLQRISYVASSTLRHRREEQSTARQAWKDLCHPLFFFSIAVTAGFFYFTEGVSEALVWGVLRPLGLGYLFFALARFLPLKQWLKLDDSH